MLTTYLNISLLLDILIILHLRTLETYFLFATLMTWRTTASLSPQSNEQYCCLSCTESRARESAQANPCDMCWRLSFVDVQQPWCMYSIQSLASVVVSEAQLPTLKVSVAQLPTLKGSTSTCRRFSCQPPILTKPILTMQFQNEKKEATITQSSVTCADWPSLVYSISCFVAIQCSTASTMFLLPSSSCWRSLSISCASLGRWLSYLALKALL